jgi:rhodanese-related sulfurtransferase
MKIALAVARTLAVVILLGLGAAISQAASAKNITSTQARDLLARDKKVVLVDVRTPEEYRQARLRGALLIPMGELERRMKELPRDRPLLIYCSVGARSLSAASFLAERGFQPVYQMSDGLVGWYKNGFPIER